MKNILFLLAIIIAAGSPLQAQKKAKAEMLENTPSIVFKEEQVNHNGAVENAFTVSIAGDHNDYEKAWKEYLSSKYKTELRKNGDYQENLTTTIYDWATTPVGVASRITKDGDRSKLILIVYNGQVAVSEFNNPEMAEKIRSSVRAQINDFYVKSYDHVIAESQKDLDKTTKSHEKLLASNAKVIKSIEKNNSKLEKLNSSISDSETNIRGLESKIDQQDSKIKSLKEKLNLHNSNKAAKASEVRMKQEQLNSYTTNNQLGSKEAERTAKELEKLRKEQTKLEQQSVKESQEIAKEEEKKAKEVSKKQKESEKLNGLKNNADKARNEIEKLKDTKRNNERAVDDANAKMNAAKSTLNSLKDSKSRL